MDEVRDDENEASVGPDTHSGLSSRQAATAEEFGRPAQGDEDEDPREGLRTFARRLLAAGIFEDALPMFQLLSLAPDAPVADFVGEVTCFLGLGRPETALQRSIDCRRVHPESRAAAIAQARCLQQLGRLEESRDIYESILRTSGPENAQEAALVVARGALIVLDRALAHRATESAPRGHGAFDTGQAAGSA